MYLARASSYSSPNSSASIPRLSNALQATGVRARRYFCCPAALPIEDDMRAAATAEWLIDASREADTTHGTVTTMNMPAAVHMKRGTRTCSGVAIQRTRSRPATERRKETDVKFTQAR